VAEQPQPSSPGDDRLREDFEAMRRNSAARSPATIPELIAFLATVTIFGQATPRYRPKDAGQCRL